MAEPNTDGGAADGAAVDEAPKKSKLMLFIMLPVMLIGSGGGAFFVHQYYPQIAAVMETLGMTVDKPASDAEEEIEYGEFYEIDGLIINPAHTAGEHVLSVNVGLEGADAAVIEEITVKQIVIRDTIILLLSKRSMDELADIEVRDAIKQELLDAVNGIITDVKVDRLYFTRYILQ